MKQERLNEIKTVIYFSLTVLIFLSLISFAAEDISINYYPANAKMHNWAGKIGANFAFIIFFLLGKAGFMIPFLTGLWAVKTYCGKNKQNGYIQVISIFILLISFASFLSLIFNNSPHMKFAFGGVIGLWSSLYLIKYFGQIGSHIIVLTLFVLSVLLATEFLFIPLAVNLFKGVFEFLVAKKSNGKIREASEFSLKKSGPAQIRQSNFEEKKKESQPSCAGAAVKNQAKPQIKTYESSPAVKKIKPLNQKDEFTKYTLPPLDLLSSPAPYEQKRMQDDFQNNAKILESTLRDFGIETKVVSVHQGPVITRYELQPAAGVKINKIVSLSDDIALTMKARSVRIVAPIPGKDRVGVEVPNSKSTLVFLRELLESREYQESESKLSLAIGKDIAGEIIITDLDNMPHLLIAGTTGSGKTVCVNSLVLSMLYKATADELKFVMVDPKMVELAPFNGLPHLLCPVVTDGKRVSAALNWVVSEMERRYKILAKMGVRNIGAYNKKIMEEPQEIMPYLVVIIDELADLMAVASQDIEGAITRLAQLSRAVGIHMILATQRPSVDVITGVIKANFPARISFQVASKVDSRTVLDMNGADKLLGKGDMLFLEPGEAKPLRAQGSLVRDEEIERVVSFLKQQSQPQYNQKILQEQEDKCNHLEFEKDELFDEAVKLVLETKQASVSILQRRMRLGYTRAARLIDVMEAKGIIGPFRGSKPREILVDSYGEQKSEEV